MIQRPDKPDDAAFKIEVLGCASLFLITFVLAWAAPFQYMHNDGHDASAAFFNVFVSADYITRGVTSFGLMIFMAILASKGWEYLNKRLKEHHQVKSVKLKNQLTEKQLDLLPQVIQSGIERGYSVKYAGAEVYNPVERIHESFKYDQPKDEPLDQPPEPYNLSQAISDYEPSERGIILGKSSKELITLPLGDSICHIAEASKTGSGKTQLNRSLTAQLLYANQEVYFLDPFFREVRINYSTGQKFDYRPFVSKLAGLGGDVETCVKLLSGAYEEVKRRQRIPPNRLVRLSRKYYILDELPYLASEDKQVMTYINTLVRVGRNFMIYLVIAAQDWQNNTLQVMSGSFRGNFITNFFGDGDAATARILLGIKSGYAMPDMTGIGRNGSWLLKADSYSSIPVKIRTPLADNEAIYQLLGKPSVPLDSIPVEDYESDMEPFPYRVVDSDLSSEANPDLEKVKVACAEIESRGKSPSRRKVAEITGFSETKAGDLLNILRREVRL